MLGYEFVVREEGGGEGKYKERRRDRRGGERVCVLREERERVCLCVSRECVCACVL